MRGRIDNPTVGDTRIVYRFLVFPLSLGNEWRWWEKAYIQQEYKELAQIDWAANGSAIPYWCWEDVCFVEGEESNG